MKLSHAVLAFVLICSAHIAMAQGTTTTSTFNDAKIAFREIFNEIEIIDPETGKTSTISRKRGDIPLTLNGAPIYDYDNATQPVGGASQKDLYSYLQTNFLIEELDNARKAIDNMDIIIDEKGSVSFVRIFFRTANSDQVNTHQKAIEKKLGTKTFIPAKKDGKAVAYRINITGL